LGIGDVKCFNPQGKIATPNMDKLAAAGMMFTDCHTSSSVCTPTRYGIMTGRYNWRSRLQKGVLGGFSPRLIEPGRLTVPEFLRQQGYHTAAFGKWHLGMEFAFKDEAQKEVDKKPGDAIDYPTGWLVDYTKPIKNGPTAVGFDYYFGISASLDMPPFVFIENDRFTKVPTTEKKWIRNGPAADDFEAIDVLPTITKRVVEHIAQRAAAAKAGKPFYVYMPLNSPHTPILPTAEWQGKSGLSPYADFVMQTDATVGKVMEALEKNGLAENTLIIMTSDNGCSPAANVKELEEKQHFPSINYRGYKADIWEGGHRVAFIARWPAQIKAGSTCSQTICLTDFMATCADLLNTKLPDNAGEDSVSILPALLAKTDKPLREAVVHHSIDGRFSIRQGQWKLELCPGSGGWGDPKDGAAVKAGLPEVQLYDMSGDAREKANLQDKNPEVVQRLTKLLEKYVADGRSTPGAPQKNTVDPDIWKKTAAAKAKKKKTKE
jgi:arylsulfatase A-like enzyme